MRGKGGVKLVFVGAVIIGCAGAPRLTPADGQSENADDGIVYNSSDPVAEARARTYRPEGTGRFEIQVLDGSARPVFRAVVAFSPEPRDPPCSTSEAPRQRLQMTFNDGKLAFDFCPGRYWYRVSRADLGEVRGEVEIVEGRESRLTAVLDGKRSRSSPSG